MGLCMIIIMHEVVVIVKQGLYMLIEILIYLCKNRFYYLGKTL